MRCRQIMQTIGYENSYPYHGFTDDFPVMGLPLREGGGYTVFKALNKDGKLLAVKELEIIPTEEALVRELAKEIDILRRNEHLNIVRYRDYSVYFEDVDNVKVKKFRFYMDFVSHDTLETRYNEFKLTETQVGLYTRHILQGIAYLHKQDIIHRDIRCGNIWVDDQGVCKLVNFGKAKELRYMKKIVSESSVGHPQWMAPEIAASEPYQKPVDIWSLGCTVLEMLTCNKPFDACGEEVDEFKVVEYLKAGQGPGIPKGLSSTASGFIASCLQVKPEARPTANELLRHSFVNPPTETAQRAARPVPFPAEAKYDLVTMPFAENPLEACESQSQEENQSIKQMCHLISKQLEENASDSTVIIINNDWLTEWQADDDTVYAKLLDFGFLKTFETDTYSCFENILESSEGDCCDTVLNEVSNRVAHGTTQGNTRYSDSTLSFSTGSAETVLQDAIDVNDSGQKSREKAGNSQEKDVLITAELSNLQLSGTASCSEDCPHIPLRVVKEKDCGPTSSGSRSRPQAMTVMTFSSPDGLFKVALAVSCCIKGDRLCIKFSCLKGEISESRTGPGTVLRQTRLSVSARVDDQDILLRLVDPDHEQGRVCSRGKAQWDYKHGKQGKSWWARFAPSAGFAPIGSISLGEVGMMNTGKLPVHICDRNESLDLVELRVGHRGCSRLNFQKVLVLERDVINTILARENNDVTCMDSHSEARPVILMAAVDPSSDGNGDLERSVEITCCAELEIDFIADNMHLDEKMRKEILHKGNRKSKFISLCDSNDHGHVTFEGVKTTANRQSP